MQDRERSMFDPRGVFGPPRRQRREDRKEKGTTHKFTGVYDKTFETAVVATNEIEATEKILRARRWSKVSVLDPRKLEVICED